MVSAPEGGTFLFVPPHGTLCSMPWNILFHPMEHLIPFIPIPHSRHRNTLFQALEQKGGRLIFHVIADFVVFKGTLFLTSVLCHIAFDDLLLLR